MGWQVIKLGQGLGSYLPTWDRLNNEIYSGHPFFHSIFVDALLKYFGSGGEYLCVHHSIYGDVDGMLIIGRRRLGVWSLFLPSQSQIAPVLVKFSSDLETLFSAIPGVVLGIELLNQDPLFTISSVQEKSLAVLAQAHALTVNVDIEGEFSNYWKGRSKNLQKNIRRYRHRAESEGELYLEAHEEASRFVSALSRYGMLESEGWKSGAGTAIRIDNSQGEFYLQVLNEFGRIGRAVVYELYLGDKLIASRLCILNDEMLIILKTTYDENYASIAPGRLLLYEVLEREFSMRRVRTVEFYTNATSDQLSWSTHQRHVNHITLFRNRWLRSIYSLARGGGEMAVVADVGSESDRGVHAVERYTDLAHIPEFYQTLFNAGERTSFDLSRDWFVHLANAGLDDSSKPVVYGVHCDGGHDSLALLPLCEKDGGKTLESLSTYYTSMYMPLMQAGDESDILPSLFHNIKNDALRCNVLKLYPLPHDEPVFDETVVALRKSGWCVFTYYCFGNWYHPVAAGGFEDYWNGLPSVLRNTIKRKKKKLFNNENGRLEIVTGGAALDGAIHAYEQIYRSSWKRPEPFPEFIPGMMRLYASKGQLRLGVIYVGDVPAAAQIWIVSHGKAAIYKLAYDEQFSDLSVGSILTAHLMQHVMDVDGVTEVDYLIGDDAYKRDWMSHRRERWGIVAYNPATLGGFLGMIKEYVSRAIKKLLRR